MRVVCNTIVHLIDPFVRYFVARVVGIICFVHLLVEPLVEFSEQLPRNSWLEGNAIGEVLARPKAFDFCFAGDGQMEPLVGAFFKQPTQLYLDLHVGCASVEEEEVKNSSEHAFHFCEAKNASF